ncbi:MAG: phosphodiester glycosidase family protein [Oscillospiraceae bacterium]
MSIKLKSKNDNQFIKLLKKGFIFILVTFIFCFIIIFGSIAIVFYGPSHNAKVFLINKLADDDKLSIIVDVFFTKENVYNILKNETINFNDKNNTNENVGKNETLEYNKITKDNFIAHTLTLKDLSRIKLVSSNNIESFNSGKTVDYYYKNNNAKAAISAGSFKNRNANQPIGLFVKNGKVYYDKNLNKDKVFFITAFDQNNKLILGYMTKDELEQQNFKNALSSTKPILIEGSGENTNIDKNFRGPWSIIGQDEYMNLVLIVIDSHTPYGVSANIDDIYKLLKELNIKNAVKLDTNENDIMIYENKVINNPMVKKKNETVPWAFIIG